MTKLETFLSALHYTTDKDDFAVIVKDILRELIKEEEDIETNLFFNHPCESGVLQL